MTPGGAVDSVASEEDEEADGEGEGEEDEEEDGGVEGEEGEDTEGGEGIRVWLIQVCILANHMNGKDTHIRRLIVFGPKREVGAMGNASSGVKRGPLTEMANAVPTNRSRTALEPGANGGNVTLAQLLSLQEEAQNGTEGDEDEEGEAASPPRKSGLSLFGNIR